MDLEEDTGAQFIHSAQSRLLLMQKLSRGEQGILPANQNQDQGQAIKNQNFTNHPSVTQYSQVAPSNCLLLNNMFDPDQADLKKDPAFFIDIKEQVEDICKDITLGRGAEKIWVE